MKSPAILVVAAFASFVLIGCGNSSTSSVATEASMAADAAEAAATPEVDAAQAMADQAAAIADSVSLTRAQQNAVRSAKSYLQISGFSREGLINQLSSDVGDGYDTSDAQAAVDSLSVDWNEQAKRSAEQYLSIQGFSCKGLVEQLSSDAGDKYTKAQAEYGAQAAGAC